MIDGLPRTKTPTPMERYPMTRHLEGSALKPGDDELDSIPFDQFRSVPLVIEEKIDGSNAAISFGPTGRLLLQSRSRVIDPSTALASYTGFIEHAQALADALWPVLGMRYVLFGEWCRQKQAVFYDELPSFFVEFDVFDRQRSAYLSTPRRRELLAGLPIPSVPVLAEGAVSTIDELRALFGPSRFKSARWRDALLTSIQDANVQHVERWVQETDPSDLMEGLYIKREEDDVVVARAKLVRDGLVSSYFHQSLWSQERPVKNRTL